jgi:hypothetical protein
VTRGRCVPGLVLAVVLAATIGIDGQALGVLRISVAVTGPEQQATPVPRYVLLVSANPATAPPRRILTTADGSVEVRLSPGNYTVESDRALAFEGKAYQWIQMFDIAAGRDTVLTLTAANAEVEALTAASDAVPLVTTSSSGSSSGAAPAPETTRTPDSIVGVWTPTTRATGVMIHANGLIATSSRVLEGGSPPIEVQLSPTVKVAASVILSEALRSVAVLWIDPATAALVPPAALGCEPAMPPQAAAREVAGVGARLGDVCELLARAEAQMKTAAPPSPVRLPVEPTAQFPADVLNNARTGRAIGQTAYQIAATDFDVAFITPLHIAAAEGRRAVVDFKNWQEYVMEQPPVLFVRATPKLVEGFWTKVARGAASTQGMALPPMKRPKAGFSRMRAFCGDTEVTPIHPFKLEHNVSDKETMYEGLYVFDPAAFPPTCGPVKFLLYSEKEPQKADTRPVDPTLIQQLWQDFAPLRPVK